MKDVTKLLRCLIVEDSEDDALLVLRQLRTGGYDVTWERVETAEAMQAALARQPWDLVLSDYMMPRFSGLAALELSKASGLDLPFIIVSGTIGEDVAVATMKAGAHDYLMKGKLARLVPAVERELRDAVERRERKQAEEAWKKAEANYRAIFENAAEGIYQSTPEGTFLTANPAMARIFGYNSPEELIAHRADIARQGYVDPDRRQEFKRLIETHGAVFGFEYEAYRKDGSKVWISEYARAVRDERGQVLRYEGTLEDITARKQSEATLRQEQALFNSLASVIPDHIYFKDRQSRFVRINDSMAQHFGLRSPAEAVGKTDFDFFTEEHARQAYEDEQRIMATGEPIVGLEEKETWPDGRITWASTTKFPLRDAPGTITGLVGISRDITERRQADEQLRKLWRVVEQGPVTVVITDATGAIEYINPKFTETTGYTIEEVRGQNPRVLKSGLTPAAVYADLWATITAGREWRGEFHDRKKNGERFWASAVISPLRDAAGRITHFVGAELDITEQKLADGKIREQAALLDTANDAITVRTLDQEILYWNQGAERLYGWTQAEVLGRKITDLNLQMVGTATEIEAHLLKEGNWTGEKKQITRTGREVTIFARLTVVKDEHGQPATIFAIDTDITEKKQLEARFLQAQRLENLGALASGIAHDLNNVLAPILLATEILKDRTTFESERQMIATMEMSARRGANIIGQVLTFARGIQGERVPLNLRHLAREMADIATETFPRNIQVEMDVPKELWPVVGDATQLHQILLNLCINARDAMLAGGQLTLAAENVTLDETFVLMTPGAKVGPYVCLKVSDTGTGIAPDHFGKIFEPFFTTKEPGKGTGLGLATVLGIVKSHGGFAQFKSAVGRGTGFAIYLPAAPGAELPAARDPAAEPPRGQGELILIVDDESAICAVASKILETYGYRVMSAFEGSEALLIYLQNRAAIAAVVTDMMMPGMDGPTLVRLLRRTDPAIRIVGITGLGEPISLKAVEALALSRLLFKPFTADKLLFALHEVLHAAPVLGHGGSASPMPGPSYPATPDAKPPMNPNGR